MSQETLRLLAVARGLVAFWKQEVQESERLLQDTKEYRGLMVDKQGRAEAQARVDELTAQVRGEALEAYAVTGNKRPWPGVQIKAYTRVEFDEAEALEWCRERAPALLKLDVPRFKRAAPHVKGAPVTTTQEYRATLARDLSGYLREEVSDV